MLKIIDKIQARELFRIKASSQRTYNEEQRGGGFRGCSGKISEGKSGHEPTSESGGRSAYRGHDTLFRDLFRVGAGYDERAPR